MRGAWLSKTMPKAIPKVLLAAVALLILLQAFVVLFGGMKYVTIPTGHYQPPNHTSASVDISPQRRAWLEQQLLPASTPIWSALLPELAPRLPDLRGFDVEMRKRQFIATILPHILRANEALLQRRQRIRADYESGNLRRLRQWAEFYRLDDLDQDLAHLYQALLLRVDAVPVALALAQAIVESGWGTSRFARQGNALFGQWAWSKGAGIKPLDASNSRAVIRAFPTLFDSVKTYMHNLNTHYAYGAWRVVRAQNRHLEPGQLALRLIPHLGAYSETREVYFTKLTHIIRENQLHQYNSAHSPPLAPFPLAPLAPFPLAPLAPLVQ